MTAELEKTGPVIKVAEPVIGFRTWRVDGGHLAPNLNHPDYIDQSAWLKGRATAKCHGRPGLCDQPYHCTCGLHAYHHPDYLPSWALGSQVTGAIVAWGPIIEHRRGFRATHARLLAFAEPRHVPECTTDAVAALYGGQTGWACCVMDPSLPVRMGDRYGVPVLPMDELVRYAGWFGDSLSPVQQQAA
jgi:hypothetical protein